MSEFSSAIATACSLEGPGTNPRPPQAPAAEGPPSPPQPPWFDPAAISKWQPPMCKPQLKNLPSGLTSYPAWLFCVWRYKERPGSKPAKIPYDAKTGLPAKVSDVSTFGSFDEATSAYKAGDYDGIGILLTGALAALDLDNCINENGQLSSMAKDIVTRMNSYTEVSPSGRGLRILFLVSPDFHFDSSRFYINNHELGIEAYLASATDKYVSLTGWTLTQRKELEERDKEVAEVLEKYMVRPQPQATALTPAAPPVSADAQLMTVDIQLIEDIQRSPSGETFMRLGCGDMSAYDNDHSRADLAFCNMIAAWTDDLAQIDRIFRNSRLMRDKWDSARGVSTYGCQTIQRALAGARAYREQNRMEQMKQAAAQSATPAPTQAEIVSAELVLILEAGQAPTQALDLAAVQAAVCVPAEAAPQPQQMQVLTTEEILEKQKQQRQQEMLVKYPIIKAQELSIKNLPPVQFFVDDMLPEGTLIFAAKSKIGKSWLCLELGIRIAAGEPFMGKATNQCGVLYMALEDGENRLQSRMKLVLQGKLPPPDFYFMTDAPTLDNGLLDVLDMQLEQHPTIKLVIVDTLARIRGESKSRDGAYAADYREMGKLQTYFRNKGVSVIFVTHLRKMDDDDVFNMINGSTGLMGAADNIWIISKKQRTDETATLHMTGRELCQNELVISFSQESHTWNSVGTRADVAEEKLRKEYEDSPVVQAIQSLVDNDTGAWRGTASDIKNHMGVASSVYTPQQVTKEILRFEDRMYKYDDIIHFVPESKTTGGKKHYFYIGSNPVTGEFVENPYSDIPEEGTDTSTDPQEQAE